MSLTIGAGTYHVINILCCMPFIDKYKAYLISLFWAAIPVIILYPFHIAAAAAGGIMVYIGSVLINKSST